MNNEDPRPRPCPTCVSTEANDLRAGSVSSRGLDVCPACAKQLRATIYSCARCDRAFTTLDFAMPIAARGEHEKTCTEGRAAR